MNHLDMQVVALANQKLLGIDSVSFSNILIYNLTDPMNVKNSNEHLSDLCCSITCFAGKN